MTKLVWSRWILLTKVGLLIRLGVQIATVDDVEFADDNDEKNVDAAVLEVTIEDSIVVVKAEGVVAGGSRQFGCKAPQVERPCKLHQPWYAV